MNGLSVEKPMQHDLFVNVSDGKSYRRVKPPGTAHRRRRTKYCPICKRRIFDVDIREAGSIDIETKCPHCSQIVVLSL